jgi:hypothetical protein
MRGALTSFFVVCLLVCSAQPLALGKKNKKNSRARLKTLQTIYVDGSPIAVSYIRNNLSQETCLTYAPQPSEADAILDVQADMPRPCPDWGARMCVEISARLLDPKTDEVLWFVEDDHLPLADVIHQTNGPYQWVLWNLKNACCKGRLLTTPPKDSKP